MLMTNGKSLTALVQFSALSFKAIKRCQGVQLASSSAASERSFESVFAEWLRGTLYPAGKTETEIG